MSKKETEYKDKIIDACVKAYLVYGEKGYTECALLRQFTDEILLPSKRQIEKWRLYGKIINKIKNGQIELENDLGVFTSSFIRGLKDSGIFYRSKKNKVSFNSKIYEEFLFDLKEQKIFIKLSKQHKGYQTSILRCGLLFLGENGIKYNWNEYLGGLFTGCDIKDKEGYKWLVIVLKSKESFERVLGVLDKYKIVYKIIKNKIYISPFYGALFFGYMPLHSACRAIDVRKPALGAKLALVYWNMFRAVGEPVAPPKAYILPFSKSYATHWNTGMLKKTNIRLFGVKLGITGMSQELRDLIKTWIYYQKN